MVTFLGIVTFSKLQSFIVGISFSENVLMWDSRSVGISCCGNLVELESLTVGISSIGNLLLWESCSVGISFPGKFEYTRFKTHASLICLLFAMKYRAVHKAVTNIWTQIWLFRNSSPWIKLPDFYFRFSINYFDMFRWSKIAKTWSPTPAGKALQKEEDSQSLYVRVGVIKTDCAGDDSVIHTAMETITKGQRLGLHVFVGEDKWQDITEQNEDLNWYEVQTIYVSTAQSGSLVSRLYAPDLLHDASGFRTIVRRLRVFCFNYKVGSQWYRNTI